MRGIRIRRVAIATLWLAAGASAAAPRVATVERVEVSRVVLDVRALAPGGEPIRGLRPEDFEVRVDGREVPVSTVDWVDGAYPSSAEPLRRLRRVGRRIVLFVQRDLDPSRISGLLRAAPHVRALLDGLRRRDRAAVVLFDTRLHLLTDFTGDRAVLGRAFAEALVPRVPDPELAEAPPPSLAASIGPDRRRRAATPERALRLVAEALADAPGETSLLYLGYGLGAQGTHPDYVPMMRALLRGRTAFHCIDLTQADWHSLEGPLRITAQVTGGVYLSTYRFPETAVAVVGRAISGHYEISFERPELPPGRHDVKVRLRTLRGVVHHRTTYAD